MIISVDIDNVLNNLTEAILSVYNADSGDDLSLSDITAYHIENFVKPSYRENFWHYFLDKRVWKRISIVDGCREVIAKLYNEGHTILFITKTEAENLPKKKNWLQRNFPFLEKNLSRLYLKISYYTSFSKPKKKTELLSTLSERV